MALLFLPNTAASIATNLDLVDGSTADGYSLNALAMGPRSYLWRSTSTTGTKTPGYDFAESVPCDYIVVARADYLLTKEGADITPAQRNSGGTWSTYGTPVAPLTAADLIGPRGQDLLIEVNPADTYGVGLAVECHGAGPEAAMMSKLFGAQSYSLGVEPVLLSSANLALGTTGHPQRSMERYEIEWRWQIGFTGVEAADVILFRGLSQIVNWPLFLYDTTAALWEWQLEHVIVEKVDAGIEKDGKWGVRITVARLRHDD